MAHLTCTRHDRRVIVLETSGHTLHRADGSRCSSGTLRVDQKFISPQNVINYSKVSGVAIGLTTYGC